MTDASPVQPNAATVAARGGRAPEFHTEPSAPPIYMTTAFDLEDLQHLDAVTSGNAACHPPGFRRQSEKALYSLDLFWYFFRSS